ncbi:MAG: insulinase family protein [Planctomycetes bacterium]|nr:insulinase family protein [Planctomycetota bacterium]
MVEKLDKHVLTNGMVILGEPMEGVESVAFSFQLPCGASLLPDGCCGAGSIISDWIFRGAGNRDSRQLIDALDGLGLHRNSSVSSGNMSLSAALESSNLAESLDIYADIILRATLDNEQFGLAKELAVSDVLSLDDDPRSKVMMILREKFYPSPLGLPALGKIPDLKNLTAQRCGSLIKEHFNLSGATFSIAGKYDFAAVCGQIERLFDIEQKVCNREVSLGNTGEKYTHIQHDGAQIHIGLMTPTVTISDDDYYNAVVTVSVLSGGMSSRLFTEVREKRGLCYAVGANYNTNRQAAGINSYAGTTPDKAQETLDVIIAEFDRLSEGIEEYEIERAKVGLKSKLIMQSESSSVRSSGIASDYYLLGRVRGIEEIKQKLAEVTVDSVMKFLANNKFADYTIVTIGPNSINVPLRVVNARE